MGWERKRGKIEEFNRLLRGATDTSFVTYVGDVGVLPTVRYCITLDSDTRLPRDTARDLLGVITHPLNRPAFDPVAGRVTDGYGILQPRVSVTYASAAGSLFARLFAGHTGVDPYTTAVSDTYQDLFGEGIFTGKGLYDVDAFTAALEDSRAGERAPLARPLRGPACPRRAGLRRGTGGRIPVECPGARPPAAPLDSRRLADPVLAVPVRAVPPRHEAQHAAAHRALEDSRQPAPQPRGADAARDAAGSVDGPPRTSRVLADERAHGHRLAVAPARRAAAGRAAEGAVVCGVLAQSPRRHDHRAGPGCAWPDLPRQQLVGNDPRGRADARPAGRHPAAPSRVGDRGGNGGAVGRADRPQRRAAVCRGDDREPDHRRSAAPSWSWRRVRRP